MTNTSARTLLMLAAMLVFSFGGGLIGGYVGGMYVARSQQAQTAHLQQEFDRISVASINAIASLATDTEIIAADMVEVTNRLDAVEVRVRDVSRTLAAAAKN